MSAVIVQNEETIHLSDEVVEKARQLREVVATEDADAFCAVLTELEMLIRHLSACIEPDDRPAH